jgi:REP element-mobilizing transposase RayT
VVADSSVMSITPQSPKGPTHPSRASSPKALKGLNQQHRVKTLCQSGTQHPQALKGRNQKKPKPTMAQSLSKTYLHITFGTKNRHPFIDDAIQQELWTYLGGIYKALNCNPIRVGGYRDHIHICCLMSKTITQSQLVKSIKTESSKWMKTKGYEKFYWQDGYSIFSVNPSEIDRVVDYIEGQREHHRHKTFQEELLAFLNKYGVDYDERYLWV